jgi:hypothetical protein
MIQILQVAKAAKRYERGQRMSNYRKFVCCVLAMSLIGCSDAEMEAMQKQQKEEKKAAQRQEQLAERERSKAKQERDRAGVILVAGVAVAALTGGSSTNGRRPPPPPPPPADTFGSRLNSMNAIFDKTQYRIPGQICPCPGAKAPASGQATYSGSAALKTDQMSVENFAIGKMELTADFAQNTFSGRMSDFLDPSSKPVAGLITISEGVITNQSSNRDDSVSAKLQGNIVVMGNDTSVTGTMSGSFREGQEPEPISPSGPGYLNGNIDLNPTTPLPLFGSFATARQ